MTYMTRQQQAVLDCIAACPGGCATAMALADRLRSGGQSVGLTTVYRQLERLEDLDIVKFYLPEFENDPSYEGLMQSLKNGDLQSAFRAAHTLKGIGYNLGLNRLGDRAAALCEVLHTGSVPAPELLRQLTEEYCCVIDAIHELKSEI